MSSTIQTKVLHLPLNLENQNLTPKILSYTDHQDDQKTPSQIVIAYLGIIFFFKHFDVIFDLILKAESS